MEQGKGKADWRFWKRKPMTPEAFSAELQAAFGPMLKSVILYGSMAAGNHVHRKSDYNVMVVLERADPETLRKCSKAAKRWAGEGHPAPLLFTAGDLACSIDVFPIEFLDIQKSRRVLFGADPFEGMTIPTGDLRHELEHELKSKLLTLRQRYLLCSGQPKQVMELMERSLTSFLVLARAALRLWKGEAPAGKMEAAEQLALHVKLDLDAFKTVDRIRRGEEKMPAQADELFARYLKTVETVAEAVDAYKGSK